MGLKAVVHRGQTGCSRQIGKPLGGKYGDEGEREGAPRQVLVKGVQDYGVASPRRGKGTYIGNWSFCNRC